MVTLRCTQKLLRRLGVPTKVETPQPTTVLGDWYANLVYSRPHQLVLCLNERALLAVLVSAREGKSLGARFRVAAASLLERIGIPSPSVEAEAKAMSEVRFGPTSNRRVLGCLNEAAFAFPFKLSEDPPPSLAEVEDWLSKHLYSLTDGRYPREIALELFGVPRPSRGTTLARVH
jgi:uncharacterized protein DUF6933